MFIRIYCIESDDSHNWSTSTFVYGNMCELLFINIYIHSNINICVLVSRHKNVCLDKGWSPWLVWMQGWTEAVVLLGPGSEKATGPRHTVNMALGYSGEHCKEGWAGMARRGWIFMARIDIVEATGEWKRGQRLEHWNVRNCGHKKEQLQADEDPAHRETKMLCPGAATEECGGKGKSHSAHGNKGPRVISAAIINSSRVLSDTLSQKSTLKETALSWNTQETARISLWWTVAQKCTSKRNPGSRQCFRKQRFKQATSPFP